MSGLRIDRVLTSGVFALDGGEWQVDNNVWVVGDDREVLVIDAAHQAGPIIDAVAGRTVVGIVCTHAHNDHITVAPELAEAFDTRILVHPDDQMLWDAAYPGVAHDDLRDGQLLSIAGTEIQVIHTPGHSPGSVCLYAPEAGELCATGRSYSDFGTIIASIRDRLLTLPAETRVRTGHGDATSIGSEAPHLEEWIRRGH